MFWVAASNLQWPGYPGLPEIVGPENNVKSDQVWMLALRVTYFSFYFSFLNQISSNEYVLYL